MALGRKLNCDFRLFNPDTYKSRILIKVSTFSRSLDTRQSSIKVLGHARHETTHYLSPRARDSRRSKSCVKFLISLARFSTSHLFEIQQSYLCQDRQEPPQAIAVFLLHFLTTDHYFYGQIIYQLYELHEVPAKCHYHA